MQSPASRFDRWKTRDERHEKRRDALRDEAIEIASRNHATPLRHDRGQAGVGDLESAQASAGLVWPR